MRFREAAQRRIRLRLLEQRLSDAPDDAADRLAARRLWIDDPAGVIGADEAIQAHEPEVRVDAHLGEDGGEAEDRLGPVRLLDRIVVAVPHEAGEPVAREQFGIGDVQIRSRQRQPAVGDDHVAGRRAGKGRIAAGERQLDRLVACGLRRQHDGGGCVGHRGRSDGGV